MVKFLGHSSSSKTNLRRAAEQTPHALMGLRRRRAPKPESLSSPPLVTRDYHDLAGGFTSQEHGSHATPIRVGAWHRAPEPYR